MNPTPPHRTRPPWAQLHPIETDSNDILAYLRSAPAAAKFLIVLNFGPEQQALDLSHIATGATIIVSTDMVRVGMVDLANLQIGPNEGLVLQIGK